MQAIKRLLQPSILKALETFPVVYINGPRQAGKTTLVKELLARDFKESHFLERCFSKDFSAITADSEPITRIIRQATFPELIHMPDKMVDIWFRNYVQKITMEDPRHI